MLKNFINDESGVILSAELVLVGTILVLGMIVGLVELQCSIIGELSDLSSALGNVDQSFSTSGFISYKASGGVKSRTYGASYYDNVDVCDCDSNLEIVCDDAGEK
jgi:Flp pilus assembly pilin Flp